MPDGEVLLGAEERVLSIFCAPRMTAHCGMRERIPCIVVVFAASVAGTAPVLLLRRAANGATTHPPTTNGALTPHQTVLRNPRTTAKTYSPTRTATSRIHSVFWRHSSTVQSRKAMLARTTKVKNMMSSRRGNSSMEPEGSRPKWRKVAPVGWSGEGVMGAWGGL